MAHEDEPYPRVDRDAANAESIDIRSLSENDEILLTVGEGTCQQEILMIVQNPLERTVIVYSNGAHFSIALHITHFSGCVPCAPGIWKANLHVGKLIPHTHPCFGAFTLPPIQRILLNGTEVPDLMMGDCKLDG